MASARAWCERTVERAAPGTEILEIQVFEESWQHAQSWETTATRPIAEAAPAGRGRPRRIRALGDPAVDDPRAGARHLI